tara:strand:+ start:201 stop:542 length:342 start_codon:yes stop_codon:yes gene_type:complete
MKCLKCRKTYSGRKSKVKLNPLLSHLESWFVCEKCVELDDNVRSDKAHDYYISNKQNYRDLHKKYKSDLSDSYVANCIADGTALTGKDIPQPLVKAKRQYMKVNRRLKEINNV